MLVAKDILPPKKYVRTVFNSKIINELFYHLNLGVQSHMGASTNHVSLKRNGGFDEKITKYNVGEERV